MVAKTKTKPRRRVHQRRPIKLSDDPAARQDMIAALVRFNAEFCRALPHHEASDQHARAGSYVHQEGDAYDGVQYPIADGKYRVIGSDWVFTFEGGGFVEAEFARAPHFGGPGVVNIDPHAPAEPAKSNG